MDQNGDIGTATRMIAAGLLSAVVTAGLVIAIGQSLMDRGPVEPSSSNSELALIRTSG